MATAKKKGGKPAVTRPRKRESSITPFLTFENGGEAAVKLYVSTFPNSRIVSLERHGEGSWAPKGGLKAAVFELDGRTFHAMDAGPPFKFEMGVSLMWTCKTQADINRATSKLSEGGEVQPCGWVKDRWGLSWQIVPEEFAYMMEHPEEGNIGAMFQAMMKMHKLDLAELKRAFRS